MVAGFGAWDWTGEPVHQDRGGRRIGGQRIGKLVASDSWLKDCGCAIPVAVGA